MKLKMIVAMTKNMGIGYNNTLPWYIKNDLKNFSKLTKGNNNNAIIMGKNTWNSLPKKPLPNRTNIILSTTLNKDLNDYNNTIIVNNINELFSFLEHNNFDDIWIIGGEMIYKLFINHKYLKEIHTTLVLENYECDTFFPGIPLNFELDKFKSNDEDKCYYCNFIRKY
jgi:dihydrofolate reductase